MKNVPWPSLQEPVTTLGKSYCPSLSCRLLAHALGLLNFSECLFASPHTQAYIKMSLLSFACAMACMCAHSHTHIHNKCNLKIFKSDESTVSSSGAQLRCVCPRLRVVLRWGGSSSLSEHSSEKDTHSKREGQLPSPATPAGSTLETRGG